MLMRTDPFRELDRLTQQFFGDNGNRARPAMPSVRVGRSVGSSSSARLSMPSGSRRTTTPGC